MASMALSLLTVFVSLISVRAIIFSCNCPRNFPVKRSKPCWFSKNATNCELNSHELIKRDVNHLRTELEVFDDGRCNSDKLKRIMKENMYGDYRDAKMRIMQYAEASIGGHFGVNMYGDYRDAKMRIMQYAEASIGGHFGVVCAPGEFSYVTKTRLFCLYSNEIASCFVFLTEHEFPIY
ncbi:hypothetical protein Tcan_16670 [Toxocara canis]|uniref:Ground-like domain-containing protein n=1 Tax=Toxocara canis TaxID=6265 RepID=A0A0B2W1K1_TOXCA|nr:hypothetical protein Tcan_16670 [Toxocara canis]